MVRRIHRTLFLTGGLVTLLSSWTVDAQTERRLGLHPETVAHGTCELGNCQPRTLSYGYYRENWRRWPEEPSTPTVTNSLSPYAKPTPDSLSVPQSAVPDPRDEASPNQRHRSSNGLNVVVPPAATPQAVTPSIPQPNRSEPAASTPPTRMPLGGPSSSGTDGGAALEPTEPLPSLPDEPEATSEPSPATEEPKSDDAPFFPSAEETPEAAPEANEAVPPAEQPGEPGEAEEAPEDLFDDLPDLGQSSPERIRRYRNERTSQYRSADDSREVARTKTRKPSASHAVARSKAPSRKPGRSEAASAVQPASFQESSATRSNPLRPKTSAKPAAPRYEEDRPVSSVRRAAPQREIEPVDFVEEDAAEFETVYEVEEPRRESSRSRARSQEVRQATTSTSASNLTFTGNSSDDEMPAARSGNPLRILK